MPNRLSLIVSTRVASLTMMLFCLSSASLAAAQSPERDNGEECSFSAIYENDQLFTDLNYTFGLLLSKNCIFLARGRNMDQEDSIWRLPHILNKAAAKWLHVYDKRDRRYVANSLYGQLSLFTPNDYSKPFPVEGDGRPYASLTIYGDSLVFLNGTNDVAFQQDIQLGLLGIPWGGRIQKEVHRLVKVDIPQGWASQISEGGEPAFLYSLQRKALVCGPHNSCGSRIFDLSTNLGGSLGYYNALHGGLLARLGAIETTPFWRNFGPISGHTFQPERKNGGSVPPIKKIARSDPPPRASRVGGVEAFLFLAGGARVILHSALLQGQVRRNAYEIPSSDVERLVPHAVVGVVVRFGHLLLSYSHSYRGREIEGGSAHRWSSLALGVVY